MDVKTIEFPRGQYAWDGDLMAIAFPATINGKRIKCIVSSEALEDHFGARASDRETAFLSSWEDIIRVARQKINAGDYLENGVILVSTFDF